MVLRLVHYNRILKVVDATPLEIKQLNISFTVKWSIFRGKGNIKRYSRNFFMNDTYLPSGFLVDVLELKKMGHEVIIENLDEFVRDIDLDDFTDFAMALTKNAKYVPYDYQIYGAYLSIKYRITRGEYATGAGKSYMQYISAFYALVKLIPKDKKIVIVVPSILLVNQLCDDFVKDYGCGFRPDPIYYGSKRNPDSRIIVSTIDSILLQDKEFYDSIGAIYYDEAHKLKSDSYRKMNSVLMNQDLAVIFSVSGTFYDEGTIEDFDAMSISGKVLKRIGAKELIEYGSISPVKIQQLHLHYDKMTCDMFYNHEDNTEKNRYNHELNFIKYRPKRYKLIKVLVERQDYNKLLLFNRKEHLNLMYKYLTKTLPNHRVLMIHGDVSMKRREEIKKITEEFTNVIVCATYGTMSTGISIKNLGGIHNCESSKSFILVRQSIGRALRLHPTKKFAEITDYVDIFKKHNPEWGGAKQNIFVKHGVERRTIYNEQAFPYTIKQINL